jgi:hypothetical protein
MYRTVASAYDHNPARIASIVRKNRNRVQKNGTSFLGTLAALAAGLSAVLSHFLSRA